MNYRPSCATRCIDNTCFGLQHLREKSLGHILECDFETFLLSIDTGFSLYVINFSESNFTRLNVLKKLYQL